MASSPSSAAHSSSTAWRPSRCAPTPALASAAARALLSFTSRNAVCTLWPHARGSSCSGLAVPPAGAVCRQRPHSVQARACSSHADPPGCLTAVAKLVHGARDYLDSIARGTFSRGQRFTMRCALLAGSRPCVSALPPSVSNKERQYICRSGN